MSASMIPTATATSNTTTGAAPAAAAGGAASAAARVDQMGLVYHIDLFLVAIFALFILFKLPRALARFWRSSEWTDGHLLRYVPFREQSSNLSYSVRTGPSSSNLDFASDDSHNAYNTDKAGRRGGALNDKSVVAPAFVSYPPHFSTCLRILRPVLPSLRARVSPGFSAGQMLILVVWFGILIYPALFMSTGPFTDPKRAGWVGVSQLPFVFALAAKNNVLGALLGAGYEKLNFMHRFLGRVVVLAINVHGIGYFYRWLIAGTFQASIKSPSNTWGLVGLVAFDLIFFCSTDWWRKNAYNFFITTHVVGFCLLFPAMWLHKPSMIPWIYACLALFALDHLFRLMKTRFSTATVRPIPELSLTRVELPSINKGWRAGQHVRIRVLTSGMGLFGWAEVHPFTIASCSEGPEGMVLMCKKTGRWTNRLYDVAKRDGHMEAGLGRNVTVMVEGPYGGPGHMMMASYSAAVFVVGGSGITFALSALQELVAKDLQGRSRVKVIHLVWVVQDPVSLVPLLPQFSALIQASAYTSMRVSVFYTRAPIGKFPLSEDFFHPRLSLSPGRPKIGKVLDSVINKTVTLGAGIKDKERNTGVLVAVCGPIAMADDVSRTVSKVDPLRRDQVGGVELYEEVFGW